MTQPRIGIIVDHPQRDLAGCVLLADTLCDAGAICFLIPMNLQFLEVTALAPDVLVMNYFRRENQHRIKLYMEAGIRVAILDTEGGIVKSFDDYRNTLGNDNEIRLMLDRYIGWGKAISQNLIENGIFREDQIAVTGNPRFDLYHSSWCDPLSVSSKNHVLVIGTFTLCNPRFTEVRDEYGVLLKNGVEQQLIDFRLECEKKALRGLIRTVKDLSCRFPEQNFVVRPHPFEDEAPYLGELGDLENVKIERSGSIREALSGAFALIHTGSTTAVEAVMLGVPVYRTGWLRDWAEVEVIHNVSCNCSHIQEMFQRLEEIFTNPSNSTSDVKTENLEPWFHKIDGKAHVRVSREIFKLAGSSANVDRERCRRLAQGLLANTRHGEPQCLSRIRYILNLPLTWSIRKMRTIQPVHWDTSAKVFSHRLIKEHWDMIRTQNSNVIFKSHKCTLRRPEFGRDMIVRHPASRSWVMENVNGS